MRQSRQGQPWPSLCGEGAGEKRLVLPLSGLGEQERFWLAVSSRKKAHGSLPPSLLPPTRCCSLALCSPKHVRLPPNLDDPAPLDSQGVLVDLDHQAVLQDLLGARGDGAEVGGHEERSCHDGPQGHLGARLLVAEAEVPDDELEGRGDKEGGGRKGLGARLRVSHLVMPQPARWEQAWGTSRVLPLPLSQGTLCFITISPSGCAREGQGHSRGDGFIAVPCPGRSSGRGRLLAAARPGLRRTSPRWKARYPTSPGCRRSCATGCKSWPGGCSSPGGERGSQKGKYIN